MINATTSTELEQFERVEAVPGTALLRVAVRAPTAIVQGNSVTLVIETQERVHRLHRLPAPPDAGGVLRAAFSAPVELLDGRVSYALELSDGSLVKLPNPVRRGRLPPAPRAEEPRAAVETDAIVAQLRADVARASTEALQVARAYEQEAAAREEAEQLAARIRVAAARDLDAARAAREQAVTELEWVRRELAQASAALDRTRQERDETLRALRRAREREQQHQQRRVPRRTAPFSPPPEIKAAEPPQSIGPVSLPGRLYRLAPEVRLGIFLLVFGLSLAIAILSGALTLG